jgi:hypothetical protein
MPRAIEIGSRTLGDADLGPEAMQRLLSGAFDSRGYVGVARTLYVHPSHRWPERAPTPGAVIQIAVRPPQEMLVSGPQGGAAPGRPAQCDGWAARVRLRPAGPRYAHQRHGFVGAAAA